MRLKYVVVFIFFFYTNHFTYFLLFLNCMLFNKWDFFSGTGNLHLQNCYVSGIQPRSTYHSLYRRKVSFRSHAHRFKVKLFLVEWPGNHKQKWISVHAERWLPFITLLLLTYPSKHKTLNQCWVDIGPSSKTLAQHQLSIGLISKTLAQHQLSIGLISRVCCVVLL